MEAGGGESPGGSQPVQTDGRTDQREEGQGARRVETQVTSDQVMTECSRNDIAS